jgi:pyocin large subunit-like protein
MVMVSDALDRNLRQADSQGTRYPCPQCWHDIAGLKRPHAPLNGREVETGNWSDPQIDKEITMYHMEVVAPIGQQGGLLPRPEGGTLKRDRGTGMLF